jgi:hypothetical protein
MVRATVNSVNLSRSRWNIERGMDVFKSQDQEMSNNDFPSIKEKEDIREKAI